MINLDPCFKPPEKPFSLDLQTEYIQTYRTIDPNVRIAVEPTIEGALNLARKIGNSSNGMQTLVTGSLYLIGGVLRLLKTNI